MDESNQFAICYQRDDGLLASIYQGQATDYGLYKLAMSLSEFRQLFPELLLVVEGHLVSHIDVNRTGMSLKGQPLSEVELRDAD